MLTIRLGLVVALAGVLAGQPSSERPAFGKTGWWADPDERLPNVLILGDSISIGYTRQARYLLKGVANVARPVRNDADAPVNCGATTAGLRELSLWLGGTRWHVIHFNWGLHDLCYRHPDSKEPGNRDKVRGKISVPPAEYARNLETLVGLLEKTGACLIFASTTVVPEGEVGRFAGDDVKYNRIAARIMQAHGIPIDDLHATTAGFPPAMFVGPGNVHFGEEANWILGRQVAESIRSVLPRCVVGRDGSR